jgi:hypothetical protein
MLKERERELRFPFNLPLSSFENKGPIKSFVENALAAWRQTRTSNKRMFFDEIKFSQALLSFEKRHL